MGCLFRLILAILAYGISFERLLESGKSIEYARSASMLGALVIFVVSFLFRFGKKKKDK